VIEGETLTDVALRVYGTADASRTLWLANRDVIDRTATPLHAGVMLRTP
jgi:nucleoid-associated protein YgaU